MAPSWIRYIHLGKLAIFFVVVPKAIARPQGLKQNGPDKVPGPSFVVN
jgi:hypothetical protein